MAFEYTVMCGAQIASTRIVAPLGTVSIAANSLAVTAESLCYLPGYGVAAAATTLVGQSLGAKRRDLARRFARMCVLLAVALMTLMGALMFWFAPAVFAPAHPGPGRPDAGGAGAAHRGLCRAPVCRIHRLGRGHAGGGGHPGAQHPESGEHVGGCGSPPPPLLAPRIGLAGVWLAMCGELCFRGVLFLIRLLRERWLDRKVFG